MTTGPEDVGVAEDWRDPEVAAAEAALADALAGADEEIAAAEALARPPRGAEPPPRRDDDEGGEDTVLRHSSW